MLNKKLNKKQESLGNAVEICHWNLKSKKLGALK